jgi:hypothetical protein
MYIYIYIYIYSYNMNRFARNRQDIIDRNEDENGDRNGPRTSTIMRRCIIQYGDNTQIFYIGVIQLV